MMMMVLVVAKAVDDVEMNEPDWGFRSYLDEDYTLTCNHSTLMPEPDNYIVWELPESNIMLTNSNNKFTLADSAVSGSRVTNMHLTIKDVKEEDAGVYVCHVYTSYAAQSKRGQMLRGLNIGGHKYHDKWDEYKDNLVLGVIVAACLFVPLVVSCFVYKFRYQTSEQKQAKHDLRAQANQHQRYLADMKANGEELRAVSTDGRDNPSFKGDINTRL